MKNTTIALVLFLTGSLASESEAAVFAGSASWAAGFRLGGTLPRDSNDTDATGIGGITDIVATVENGNITYNSVQLRSGSGSITPATASGVFTDPVTFQQTTISAAVSIDSFSYSFSIPTQALTSNGGMLAYDVPDASGLTITGAYSLVGSNETVNGTFTSSFSVLGSGSTMSSLDVSDFPNSISVGGWGYVLLGGRFATPIASRTVDGVDVDLEFSFNRNFLSPFDTQSIVLTPVPEPSTSALLIAAISGLFLRTRKRG